eukprot:TRINITY_DN33361_c0_g2_i1.p3 TRINITY_DN33361_c0_g2~~TRINITY_DN33361_c0_g2_i1.p3  ORF type:complete len:261 (+),score=32.90 TRINITY_DN33361_c0_g2_i1:495-1277(+)
MVDDDGSGTLEHCELLDALQASGIPCEERTITEMILMMDKDQDGSISLEEFENFMKEEISLGKDILEGEYILPSGQALPMGSMLMKMNRQKIMEQVYNKQDRKRIVNNNQEYMQMVNDKRKSMLNKTTRGSVLSQQSNNQPNLGKVVKNSDENQASNINNIDDKTHNEQEEFIDDVYTNLKQEEQIRLPPINNNVKFKNINKRYKLRYQREKNNLYGWHDVMSLPNEKTLHNAKGKIREIRTKTPWLPMIRGKSFMQGGT